MIIEKLTEENYFNKFIEDCEANIVAAPENFASSVMQKINAKKIISAKFIPFLSRKMAAAVCFCSAAVIMTLTLSGVNSKIFDFISNASIPDKIRQFGDFLNIITKFNIN